MNAQGNAGVGIFLGHLVKAEISAGHPEEVRTGFVRPVGHGVVVAKNVGQCFCCSRTESGVARRVGREARRESQSGTSSAGLLRHSSHLAKEIKVDLEPSLHFC